MTDTTTLYRMRSPMGGLYVESTDGTLPLQWTELTLADAAIRALDRLDRPSDDLAFDLATVLLKLTSKKATAFFELTGEPRAINVRYNPESLRNTFRSSTKMFNEKEKKGKRLKRKKKINEIETEAEKKERERKERQKKENEKKRNEMIKRMITLDFERLTKLFAATYGPVRRKIGWGEPQPTDYHYAITPDKGVEKYSNGTSFQ